MREHESKCDKIEGKGKNTSLTFPKQHYLFQVRGFHLRLPEWADTPRCYRSTPQNTGLADNAANLKRELAIIIYF